MANPRLYLEISTLASDHGHDRITAEELGAVLLFVFATERDLWMRRTPANHPMRPILEKAEKEGRLRTADINDWLGYHEQLGAFLRERGVEHLTLPKSPKSYERYILDETAAALGTLVSFRV